MVLSKSCSVWVMNIQPTPYLPVMRTL